MQLVNPGIRQVFGEQEGASAFDHQRTQCEKAPAPPRLTMPARHWQGGAEAGIVDMAV